MVPSTCLESWDCLNLTSPVGNAMHCSLDCHKFIGITTNASVFAQGLVSNLITAGHGREAAFAAAVLGDNALMEKAWQDTGMLAEAVLHAQVSSFEFSHAQSYFMSCKPLWFCVITFFWSSHFLPSFAVIVFSASLFISLKLSTPCMTLMSSRA
jgi:hypothetical protein